MEENEREPPATVEEEGHEYFAGYHEGIEGQFRNFLTA
jgi:hypothetical protein